MSTPADESTNPPAELHSDLTAAAASTTSSSHSGDAHPDPISGEPDAHPAAVGVGALSAGAVGAAVGALMGPVGVLVGAAVGALAGGLAGHDVASNSTVEAAAEESPTGEGLGFTADLSDEPAAFVAPNAGSERADTFVDGLPAGSAYFASGAAAESEDTVRTTAYYHYKARVTHGYPGDEVSDWYEAEREVRQQEPV